MKNKYSFFAWGIFVLVVFFLGFMFYMIWQGEKAYGYKTAKKVIKGSMTNEVNVNPVEAPQDQR